MSALWRTNQFQLSAVGAVARAQAAKLAETKTPYDFGAIGDGTSHPLSERFALLIVAQVVYPFVTALTQTIDWAACQAWVNYCLANDVNGDWGDGSYYSLDTLIVKPIVAGRRFSFRGRGTRSTWQLGTDGVPNVQFNITGVGDLAFCEWTNLFTIGINGTVNVAQVHYRFTGDASFFQRSDFSGLRALYGYAVFKDEKTPTVNGFGNASALNWNVYTGLIANGVTKYIFWGLSGSGTGNVWNDWRVTTAAANSAVHRFEGANAVVGDVILVGVHAGCSDAVTGSAMVSIGASTNYRAQVNLKGCQWDANCNRAVEMDGVGAVEYVNWNIQGNNHGGNSDLGTTLQPLSRSIVEDRHTSRWEAGVSTTSGATGAQTLDSFEFTFSDFGAAIVEVFASGIVGGVSACVSRYVFAITSSATVTTAAEADGIESTAGQLTWTYTDLGAATKQGKLTFSFNPTAGGTKLDATIIARGKGFKVRRMVTN